MFPECIEELKQSVKYKGPRTIVTHTRKVPHEKMPAVYNTFHCLLHPVDHESFSLTVAEALSSGVPVVVPSCGAPKEFIGMGGVPVNVSQFVYDEDFARQLAHGLIQVEEKQESYAVAARRQAISVLDIRIATSKYLQLLGISNQVSELVHVS
jgi:glycosyltransferase involved in cell wall biosynthesis